ncbi:uncharacterized protein LOC106170663 [Lingula anatina]|uniref:Uncharacterized protein LOC106170663 n=1 Tax=Lingula anatina TaxID=7574 RepID=A0A1S3J6S1_LINAN|nr:uncharacterized protein LOC106170663 [Lingula anatina]|eukprot:XP_013406090.1 uncharacterized protein LOC106170663 [Lingula anatina]
MKACASLSRLSRLMTMKNKYEYHNMVRFLSTATEYWIGDDTTSGSSSLSNGGTKLGTGSFTIWDAGFPSARSLTNCVDLSGKSGTFLWQDAPCWERKPFICELRPKDALAPIVG